MKLLFVPTRKVTSHQISLSISTMNLSIARFAALFQRDGVYDRDRRTGCLAHQCHSLGCTVSSMSRVRHCQNPSKVCTGVTVARRSGVKVQCRLTLDQWIIRFFNSSTAPERICGRRQHCCCSGQPDTRSEGNPC
jgi:hypothetical protein